MTRRHGNFAQLARESEMRKEKALKRGSNSQVPHDLWRRLIPIALEYDRRAGAIAMLYTYLLTHVNGQPDNDRYMSAFPSVDRIAQDTGIGRNRVALLSSTLEAVGLLKIAYDYTGNKRQKLYYPQYYSDLSDDEIRHNLSKITIQ